MVRTMNHAEELCHSSGPWKKHKYFQKIGEGAKAIYKYKVTGEGYKEEADSWDKSAKEERERAEMLRKYYGEDWDTFTREKQMELILKSYNPHEGEAEQAYKDQLNLAAKKDAFDKNPTFGARSTAADYVLAGRRKDRHARESQEREKNYQKLVKEQEDRTFWAEQRKNSMRAAIRGAIDNSTQYQKNAASKREDYRKKSLKGVAETSVKNGQKIIDNLFGKKKTSS